MVLIALWDEHALGVRALSGALRRAGHDCTVIFFCLHVDFQYQEQAAAEKKISLGCVACTQQELDLLVESVKKHRPQLIGISLISLLLPAAKVLTDKLREALPETPIAWGGIEPTLSPETALEHADLVCVGEGEPGILELARALDEGTLFSRTQPITNFIVKQEGRRLAGETGLMVSDLDELAFCDFDPSRHIFIYQGQRWEGAYPPGWPAAERRIIMSARGCPYQCAYCANGVLRRLYHGAPYVRRQTPERFVQELKACLGPDSQVKWFNLFDDVFTMDGKWIERFCTLYKQEIAYPFTAYTHPLSCRKEIIEQLCDAGCFRFTIGVQSGSDRILKEVYHRPATRAAILAAARTLHTVGVGYNVDLIGNNPLETEVDCRETLTLLLQLPKPYTLHPVNPLSFYRGYQLTNQMLEQGLESELEQLDEGAKYGARPRPEYAFWNALYTLAPYEGMTEAVLLPLVQDEYLRARPEALWGLVRAVIGIAHYRWDIYTTKSDVIARLESELRALRGSRLVRLAIWLRQLRRRWFGRTGKCLKVPPPGPPL